MRTVIAMLACSAPALACASTPIDSTVHEAGRRQITRAALEAPIRFLASDALEGRGPGTRGDALARLYLATELQSLGYEPAGVKGTWEQPFDRRAPGPVRNSSCPRKASHGFR